MRLFLPAISLACSVQFVLDELRSCVFLPQYGRCPSCSILNKSIGDKTKLYWVTQNNGCVNHVRMCVLERAEREISDKKHALAAGLEREEDHITNEKLLRTQCDRQVQYNRSLRQISFNTIQ